MAGALNVVLQINTHPNDVRHVEHTIAHHIRVWGGQVSRVLVVLDLHLSEAGRYHADNHVSNARKIRRILQNLQERTPLDVEEVDYRAETKAKVAKAFFRTEGIPEKAWDGGPFYSYFYGLWAAGGDYVLHMDSDMLFGGGSRTWIAEAVATLHERSDLLFAAPLSGPPRPDGQLFGQGSPETGAIRPDPHLQTAYLFRDVSTRIFLTGQSLLRSRVGPLDMTRPNLSQRLRSRLMGNAPHVVEAETLLSYNMQAHRLSRIDMLGSGSGIWSLHPPYRSEQFYQELPRLIDRIEHGDIPDAQRGHYDVHDSLIDWSAQRRMDSRYYRWHRHIRRLGQRFLRSTKPHIDTDPADGPAIK
jgi:hypothetical protein